MFCKFSSAILGDGETIVLPRVSNEVDYEAELVAVIGVGGRHISKEDALTHVAGYCCGNDVSARDWQQRKPGGQWLLGKSFDTFAPIGPALVTADEIPSPERLAIELRINGRVMQQSNTVAASVLDCRVDRLRVAGMYAVGGRSAYSRARRRA